MLSALPDEWLAAARLSAVREVAANPKPRNSKQYNPCCCAMTMHADDVKNAIDLVARSQDQPSVITPLNCPLSGTIHQRQQDKIADCEQCRGICLAGM